MTEGRIIKKCDTYPKMKKNVLCSCWRNLDGRNVIQTVQAKLLETFLLKWLSEVMLLLYQMDLGLLFVKQVLLFQKTIWNFIPINF